MGLIRFIIFALFFYLIYFLVKYIFVRPFKEGYSRGGRKKNPFSREEEGKVTIDYDPRQKRSEGNKVGEYIDYEEVKD